MTLSDLPLTRLTVPVMRTPWFVQATWSPTLNASSDCTGVRRGALNVAVTHPTAQLVVALVDGRAELGDVFVGRLTDEGLCLGQRDGGRHGGDVRVLLRLNEGRPARRTRRAAPGTLSQTP